MVEDMTRPASKYGSFLDGSFALPTEESVIREGMVQDASRSRRGREVQLPGTGLMGATDWSRLQNTMKCRDMKDNFAQND